jgi:ribosome-associated protein
MLKISNTLTIPAQEIDIQFVRSQGAGGQHVNKTSTAVHLFFDIRASEVLPQRLKQKLLTTADHRISKSGKIIIKSQGSRSQDRNREVAFEQFTQILVDANKVEKKRIATKIKFSSKLKRLDKKTQRGKVKKLRTNKEFLNLII